MTRWIVSILILVFIAGGVSANTTSSNCPNCANLLAEADGLLGGEWRVFTEDEDIIFLYRAVFADIDRVWTCCGIQENLNLLDTESQVWGLRYHVPHLDEAIIGYSFSEIKQHESRFWSGYQIWRGDNAPAAPPYANPLRGRIAEARLESQALREQRGLMIYYPPDYDNSLQYPVIYATDGQSIGIYVPYLEELIMTNEIPPLLVIGAYSGDYRMDEYLPSFNPQRFAAHEQFFTHELRLWAEANLGASTERGNRAVFGFSNGGVFAGTMALLHPELYGIAFPFSAGMTPFEFYPNAEIEPNQQLYFTAGTLEGDFLRATRDFSERFAEAGAQVVFSERIAGHDFYMWQEEFYYAIRWAFGH